MSKQTKNDVRQPTSGCLLGAVLVLLGCGAESPVAGDSMEPADAGLSARCPTDTPEFSATPATGLLARAKKDSIQARIIKAEPAMPERFENDWTIRLTDLAGAPLNDIEIADACVYMPVHGHGSAPSGVTGAGEPGTFDLKGLNLFMRGPWEVQLAVSSASVAGPAAEATNCDRNKSRPGHDLLVFQVCVPDD